MRRLSLGKILEEGFGNGSSAGAGTLIGCRTRICLHSDLPPSLPPFFVISHHHVEPVPAPGMPETVYGRSIVEGASDSPLKEPYIGDAMTSSDCGEDQLTDDDSEALDDQER